MPAEDYVLYFTGTGTTMSKITDYNEGKFGSTNTITSILHWESSTFNKDVNQQIAEILVRQIVYCYSLFNEFLDILSNC